MQRDILGRRIRELRKAKGIKGKELALRVGVSAAAISKIERGLLRPTSSFVDKVVEVIQLNEADARALKELEAFFSSQFRRWSTNAIDTERNQLVIGQREANAQRIRCYSNQLIHGLLQSSSYMRAIFQAYSNDSSERIDKLIQLRQRRARILKRKGASYVFVISEGALRTIFGSDAIMCNELVHLSTLMDDYSSLEIRVLPFGVSLTQLPLHHFVIYDERSVEIEVLKGQLDLWVKEDVDSYIDLMNYLVSVSVPLNKTEFYVEKSKRDKLN